MTNAHKHSRWWSRFFGGGDDVKPLAVSLLLHAYVREQQQAMRYRQHAERMRYTHFREVLIRLAQAEDAHAGEIARKLEALGAPLPDVVPVRFAPEQNSWYYLRTDLEEEQRCAGELEADLTRLGGAYSDIAEMMRRIERDGRKHRAALRDMLARSDPQAAALA
jgi:rubrerythrin